MLRAIVLLPVLSFALSADDSPQAGEQLPAPATGWQRSAHSLKFPLVEPIPVVTERALAAGALTPGEKSRLMLKGTFGMYGLLNRMALAGYSQWENHPEEWGQGWDAYGKRLASRMGRMAIRNTMRLGLDVALKTDPRYDRCDCSGIRRVAHAARRVVIARSDYGGETFATARVVSGMAAPWVAYEWYPDRLNTTERKLRSGAGYLAWRVVNNVVAEFWPDVKHKLFKR
jgi:hypothetical protein